jgi:hypothetical protein
MSQGDDKTRADVEKSADEATKTLIEYFEKYRDFFKNSENDSSEERQEIESERKNKLLSKPIIFIDDEEYFDKEINKEIFIRDFKQNRGKYNKLLNINHIQDKSIYSSEMMANVFYHILNQKIVHNYTTSNVEQCCELIDKFNMDYRIDYLDNGAQKHTTNYDIFIIHFGPTFAKKSGDDEFMVLVRNLGSVYKFVCNKNKRISYYPARSGINEVFDNLKLLIKTRDKKYFDFFNLQYDKFNMGDVFGSFIDIYAIYTDFSYNPSNLSNIDEKDQRILSTEKVNISDLPDEMILEISSHLNKFSDRLNLAVANIAMRNIMSDNQPNLLKFLKFLKENGSELNVELRPSPDDEKFGGGVTADDYNDLDPKEFLYSSSHLTNVILNMLIISNLKMEVFKSKQSFYKDFLKIVDNFNYLLLYLSDVFDNLENGVEFITILRENNSYYYVYSSETSMQSYKLKSITREELINNVKYIVDGDKKGYQFFDIGYVAEQPYKQIQINPARIYFGDTEFKFNRNRLQTASIVGENI